MMILLNVAGAGLSVGVITGILVIILLLAASALVSGAEVAFFSLGPNQLHELRLREEKHDLAVLHLVGTPKRLLATILISNNFINVAIIVISTFVTNRLFDFAKQPYWLVFLIQVVVITALILLMGEVLPKVYATRRNIELARFMSGPMQILIKVFYPLSSPLMRSTNLIERKISRKMYNVSMSELSDAIELTSGENTPAEEKKILQGIVKFGDIEVKEIMKSRVDVTAIEITTSFRELLQLIIEAGYSRVPVYEDSFDHVKGILYIKDMLPFLDKDDNFEWTSLLRDAFFVPENKKINDLLQEFQEKKIHMAVVVDEYGGTSGIVTLEDIIEEIVGEISDEHDEPVGDVDYTRLDDRNFLFEGKTSLNDLCKILGINDDIFDGVKGDADSLAGLILELLEKMPDIDEKVSFEQFTFTVKAVDKRRIKRVLVTIAETPEEEEDA
ncbi:MAG: gliding motility-associated protein GldE [Bacteroidales bacterium]|nr:gliding motility-associated protein GldE [Bacteroidales bacterium]